MLHGFSGGPGQTKPLTCSEIAKPTLCLGPAMRISQLSKPEEAEAHTDSVWSCVWTPAGNQLITASVDETVSVYSDDQGKLSRYHAYPGHTLGAISVAVDPTGEFAASSALDSYIRWDTGQGSTSRCLQ